MLILILISTWIQTGIDDLDIDIDVDIDIDIDVDIEESDRNSEKNVIPEEKSENKNTTAENGNNDKSKNRLVYASI